MGGGVTISGGEPLVKMEFTRGLFRAAKEMRLHTALDTSGYLGHRCDDGYLHLVDLVLLDIKSGAPETYSRATGKELEPTLRNGGKTTTAIGPDRDEWPAWVGKSHWLKSGRTSAVGGFERARFRVTMLWKRTFVLRRKLAERRPAAFGRRAQQAAIRSGWRRSAVHDPKWTLALEIARCWKL
jgi:hypothetical protein